MECPEQANLERRKEVWRTDGRVMAIEVSSFEDDNENALMVTDDDCTHLRM